MLAQMWLRRLRGVEVAEQMRMHEAVEDLYCIVVEERPHQRVGTVGDHDVEHAERRRRLIDRRLDLREV